MMLSQIQSLDVQVSFQAKSIHTDVTADSYSCDFQSQLCETTPTLPECEPIEMLHINPVKKSESAQTRSQSVTATPVVLPSRSVMHPCRGAPRHHAQLKPESKKAKTEGPRKNWHGICEVKDHRSFGHSVKSCRECVLATLAYNAHWCSICWRDGVRLCGVPTLTRFKTCRPHSKDYDNKKCPCGKRWTDCLDCRDAGVDPRAGTAFCGRCRKRFGAGRVDFCVCKA